MSFKAAAIQMCSGIDPEKNVADMVRLVRDAASRGAVYVQTPEMTGAIQRDRPGLRAILRNEADDLVVAAASRTAVELGIHLHIGSTAIALDEGKIANRGFLFGPDGGLVTRYDKIHMFDVDLDNGESWRESAVYRPGAEARVVSLPFAKLGFSICYDVRFPELFRSQAVAGAEVMSIPAAFTRQTGEAHWEILLRARAIENGMFVIAAAQAGVHQDGRETYGHSMIVDPWGKVLASAGGTGEAVLVADIDVSAVKAARDKIPNLKNGRAFTLETIEAATAGGCRCVIRYSLSCDHGHEFEGWFSQSADFERQVESGLLTCPTCGSSAIGKMLMAPSVSTARTREALTTLAMDTARKQAIATLKDAVAAIKANSEDVGPKFPEEARKIHYGEADARGIIGQATPAEARSLIEEGIEIAPLPTLPDDAN